MIMEMENIRLQTVIVGRMLHTRMDLHQIPIVYDNDDMVAGEIGQKLYNADIEWCNRFCIENISYLKSRILTNEEYQRLWIGRCDRSYALLTQTTEEKRKQMQDRVPELFLYGGRRNWQRYILKNLWVNYLYIKKVNYLERIFNEYIFTNI